MPSKQTTLNLGSGPNPARPRFDLPDRRPSGASHNGTRKPPGAPRHEASAQCTPPGEGSRGSIDPRPPDRHVALKTTVRRAEGCRSRRRPPHRVPNRPFSDDEDGVEGEGRSPTCSSSRLTCVMNDGPRSMDYVLLRPTASNDALEAPLGRRRRPTTDGVRDLIR